MLWPLSCITIGLGLLTGGGPAMLLLLLLLTADDGRQLHLCAPAPADTLVPALMAVVACMAQSTHYGLSEGLKAGGHVRQNVKASGNQAEI